MLRRLSPSLPTQAASLSLSTQAYCCLYCLTCSFFSQAHLSPRGQYFQTSPVCPFIPHLLSGSGWALAPVSVFSTLGQEDGSTPESQSALISGASQRSLGLQKVLGMAFQVSPRPPMPLHLLTCPRSSLDKHKCLSSVPTPLSQGTSARMSVKHPGRLWSVCVGCVCLCWVCVHICMWV